MEGEQPSGEQVGRGSVGTGKGEAPILSASGAQSNKRMAEINGATASRHQCSGSSTSKVERQDEAGKSESDQVESQQSPQDSVGQQGQTSSSTASQDSVAEAKPNPSVTLVKNAIESKELANPAQVTEEERVRTRSLAQVLLSLATCTVCRQPFREPVTLPCGHSICLGCIRRRASQPLSTSSSSDSPVPRPPVLPCLTHVPPRLPLSTMTVPCPVNGCPRSAIGRGIGIWAGHQPRYGMMAPITDLLPTQEENVGPGSPPVDGFVVGVPDHPFRLSIIGAQPRAKAHLFAAQPTCSESPPQELDSAPLTVPTSANSNVLRPDVTLAKAIAVIKRYHGPQSSRSSLSQSSSATFSTGSTRRGGFGSRERIIPSVSPNRGRARGRVQATARFPGLHRGRGAPSSSNSTRSRDWRNPGRSGTRRFTQNIQTTDQGRIRISSSSVGLFGADESELESGTVGGVRAWSDTDEDEVHDHPSDDEDGYYESSYYQDGPDSEDESQRHASDHEDTYSATTSLWPDDIGGAFARPGQGESTYRHVPPRRNSKSKRRRTRTTLGGSRYLGEDVKMDAVRRVSGNPLEGQRPGGSTVSFGDSGWNTEDSQNVDGRESAVEDTEHTVEDGGLNAREKSPCCGSQGRTVDSPPAGTVASLHTELLEVLECQLCYLLLYQPLTTPCGHTFCKPCFARSLDHSNKCPLCRAEVPSFAFFQDHPSNATILKILTAETGDLLDRATDNAPCPSSADVAGPANRTMALGDDAVFLINQEPRADPARLPHEWGMKRLYDERKAAIEQEEREARLSTPIFVCTLAFPGMPTILHIFEPRYRLMVRRCLESGNPRFGMVLPSRNTDGPVPGVHQYGTMLEIKSVQMLADGRSMLETVGSYRFKLLEKGSLDGYSVGRIERVDDISLEMEAELEAAAMARRREAEKASLRSDIPRGPSSSQTDETSGPSTVEVTRTPEAERQSQAEESSDTQFGTGDADAELIPSLRTPSPTGAADGSGSDEDRSPSPSEMSFAPLPAEPSTAELISTCHSFIETLRSGSAPWLITRLNHTYGPMPGAHEVEKLGYWMALVMPIDEHEKAKLLPITSRRLRLCLVVHWIEQLRQSWWFNSGCTIS